MTDSRGTVENGVALGRRSGNRSVGDYSLGTSSMLTSFLLPRLLSGGSSSSINLVRSIELETDVWNLASFIVLRPYASRPR